MRRVEVRRRPSCISSDHNVSHSASRADAAIMASQVES